MQRLANRVEIAGAQNAEKLEHRALVIGITP